MENDYRIVAQFKTNGRIDSKHYYTCIIEEVENELKNIIDNKKIEFNNKFLMSYGSEMKEIDSYSEKILNQMKANGIIDCRLRALIIDNERTIKKILNKVNDSSHNELLIGLQKIHFGNLMLLMYYTEDENDKVRLELPKYREGADTNIKFILVMIHLIDMLVNNAYK